MSRHALRYTLFGLLYFTQGTIMSYFTALNELYFLSRGLSMADSTSSNPCRCRSPSASSMERRPVGEASGDALRSCQ